MAFFKERKRSADFNRPQGAIMKADFGAHWVEHHDVIRRILAVAREGGGRVDVGFRGGGHMRWSKPRGEPSGMSASASQHLRNVDFFLGFVGLWVCGFVGLWVCGFVDLWICGFVDLWICGFVGLWVCESGVPRQPGF